MSNSTENLSLVSINIERNYHLDLVFPFLLKQKPDVICLQEILEEDFFVMQEKLGMKGFFSPMAPMMLNNDPTIPHMSGIAMLSRLPLENMKIASYFNDPEKIQRDIFKTQHRVLLTADIHKDDSVFTIGTTHFTWTPDGEASDNQRRDIEALLKILKTFPEIIFCGDFNAPRGKEIFTKLKEHYTDHIPLSYTTSIDGNLHKMGPISEMVDGLFSTKEYQTKNVSLISGLSDHAAIVATIAKN